MAVSDMFYILLVVLAACCSISAETIQGVMPLNAGTFDKVINRFKVVLVKFDEAYPYGEKHDQWKNLATSTLSQPDLLLGEVNIQDYGDKDNHDLADRYNVKVKDDFPAYKLFLQGRKDPVTYTGEDKTENALKQFLVKESGVWLGLPACIERFDVLVKEFFATQDAKERQAVVSKAETEAGNVVESQKQSAEVYVKTMKKILEKGDDFVNSELKRVDKLKDQKVSDKKKAQLKDRLNILTSFQMRLNAQKDEL